MLAVSFSGSACAVFPLLAASDAAMTAGLGVLSIATCDGVLCVSNTSSAASVTNTLMDTRPQLWVGAVLPAAAQHIIAEQNHCITTRYRLITNNYSTAHLAAWQDCTTSGGVAFRGLIPSRSGQKPLFPWRPLLPSRRNMTPMS